MMQLTIQYSEESLEQTLEDSFETVQELLRDLKNSGPQSLVDVSPYVQQVRAMTRRLKEPLKIAVVGDFKRGKSTFINALLGHEVVTMNVLPETVLITEVHAGTEESTEIHLEDGGVIRLQTEDRESERLTSIIEHIQKPIRHLKVVHTNADLNNIMLVDTPGLGDLNWRFEHMVRSWIHEADVIFYVTSAISPLSQSERQFLYASVQPLELSKLKFVVNMMDQIGTQTDRDKIMHRIQTELHRDFPDASVVGISALDALTKQVYPDEIVDESLYEIFQGLQTELQSSYAEQKDIIRAERQTQKLDVLLGLLEQEIQVRMNDISTSSLDETLNALQEQLDGLAENFAQDRVEFQSVISDYEVETIQWMSEFVERFYAEVMPQFEAQSGEHAQRHFPFFASDVFRDALGVCMHHHLRQLEVEFAQNTPDSMTSNVEGDVSHLSQRTSDLFHHGWFSGNVALVGGYVQLLANSSSIGMLGMGVFSGSLSAIAVAVGMLAGSSLAGIYKDQKVVDAEETQSVLNESKEQLTRDIAETVRVQYAQLFTEIGKQHDLMKEHMATTLSSRIQNVQQLLVQDTQQVENYRAQMGVLLDRCHDIQSQVRGLRTRQVQTLQLTNVGDV